MDILFWGLTIGIIGKLLIGISVINVHWHVIKERHIDKDVIWAMKRERWVALIGVLLMVVGYVLELVFYGYLPTIELMM